MWMGSSHSARGRPSHQDHGVAVRLQIVLEIAEGAVDAGIPQGEEDHVLSLVKIGFQQLGALAVLLVDELPVLYHGHVDRYQLLFGQLRHGLYRDLIGDGLLGHLARNGDHLVFTNEPDGLQGHVFRVAGADAHAVCDPLHVLSSFDLSCSAVLRRQSARAGRVAFSATVTRIPRASAAAAVCLPMQTAFTEV